MAIDLKAKWHGLPMYAWYGGIVTLGATSYILIQRYRRSKALATADTSSNAVYLPDGDAYGLGYGPGSGGTSGGSSGSGLGSIVDTIATLFERNSEASQKQNEALVRTIQDQNIQEQNAWNKFLDTFGKSPPATTVAAGQPANRYHIGEQVTPSEKIIASVWSPVYGWINQTSLGGIYQGGGSAKGIGDLPYGGSYLGYVASKYGNSPDAQAEIGQHGSFTGQNSLVLLPGGGYEEVNSKGEKYDFPV